MHGSVSVSVMGSLIASFVFGGSSANRQPVTDTDTDTVKTGRI